MVGRRRADTAALLVPRRDGLVLARVDFFAGAAFVTVVFFTALVAVFFAAFFAGAAFVAFVTRPAATSSLKPVPGRNAGTEVFFTRTA